MQQWGLTCQLLDSQGVKDETSACLENRKVNRVPFCHFSHSLREYLSPFIPHSTHLWKRSTCWSYRTSLEGKAEEQTSCRDVPTQHVCLPQPAPINSYILCSKVRCCPTWISSVIPGEGKNSPFYLVFLPAAENLKASCRKSLTLAPCVPFVKLLSDPPSHTPTAISF